MKTKNGFTLVELLIVVSLLSFLAIVSLAFFRGQIFKGADAKKKADIRRIQTALEEYQNDNECYPTVEMANCEPGKGLAPYLNKIPCDPETNLKYQYEHENATCPKWYRLYAKLTNLEDTDIKNLSNGY